MKRVFRIASILAVALSVAHCAREKPMTFGLDYDEMIFLDAEDLAEEGISEAYQSLLPHLRRYVDDPAEIEEITDHDLPSYSVRALGSLYEIYAPNLEYREGQSWGRATFAFFKIVNEQLTYSDHQFYAINGGNDLGGMFLTSEECAAAIQSLENKSDWPYIPTEEHPWYGQHH